MITRDEGIRHRETELAALKSAGVAAFVLTASGVILSTGSRSDLAKISDFLMVGGAGLEPATSAL